jgi:hypothetical protein
VDDELKFMFMGWCTKMENGTKHDKVWVAFKIGTAYYASWGRRGKKLSFKKHDSRNSLEKVMCSKQNKYNEVDAFQLFTIFPFFKEEVEQHLLIAVLSNKVK